MSAHPTRLLIGGYITALGLAILALPAEGGVLQVLLAVWLFGPLFVLGLAMLPGINRAFLDERRTAPQSIDVIDGRWVVEEEELRAWDRDLHADLTEQRTLRAANDDRRSA
ncbi:MAG: hypothetical protein AAGC57_01040 [Pseudomonadota bacterium]